MDFNQYFMGKIIRQTRDFLLSLAGYRWLEGTDF